MSRFVVASKPETKTKPSSARRTSERTPRATAVVAPRKLPDAPESAEPLQAKLTIGEVDDPLEREADHVADHVMRMPSSASPSGESNPTGDGSGVNVRSGVIQRECSTCAEESASEESLETEDALDDETSLSSSAVLQRACSSCSEESSDEERLQRDSAPATGARKMSSTPSGRFARELEAARSTGGRALPRAVRAFMEPRFGLDLSHVRVHTDARAGELNRHVSARAFTVGHDIFFRPSEFNPDTQAGRRLIAHELTHTVQQRRGLGSVQREIVQREVIQREEAPGGVAARAGSDVQHPIGAPDADLVQPGNPPAPFAVPTPETAGVEIAPTEALEEPDLTEPTDEGAFEEQLESQAPQDTTGTESLESGFASIEAAPPAEELVEEEDEPAATMSEDPGVLRRNEAITKLRDQISARNLELEEVAASTRAGIHDAAVAQRERVASTLSAERDALSAATEAQLEQLAAAARAARDSIVTARDTKIEEVLQAADAESEKLETLIQAKITKLMEVARGKAKEARALGEAQAVRVEKASRANADSAIVTGTRVINAFSGADQPGRIQSEVRKESSRVAARLLEHGVGLAGQARSRAEAIAQVILDDAVQTGETFETEVRPRALTRIEQERNQATERIRRMADEPLNQLSALEASLGERLKATESSFANILSQLAGATSADIGTAEIRANARLDVDLERALAELSAFAVEGEGLLSTASPELATERLSELSGAVDEGVAGYLTSLNRYGVAVEEQMTARADQVVARSTARTNGNSALGGVGAALETKLAELATNVARDIDEVASGGVQQMAEVTRSAGTDLDSAIDQKDTVWAGDLIRDTAKIREDVDTELAKQDATVRGLEPTLRQLAQEIADESLLERVAKFVGGVLVGALVAGLILLAVGAAIALVTPALVALVGALVAVVIAGGPLAVLAAVALVVLAGAAVYLIVTGIIDGWRKVSEEAWRDDLSSFEGGMKFGEGIVDIVGSVLGLSALRTILRRGLQRGAAKAAARRRPGALEGPAESGKPPRTLTAPETKADLAGC